MNSDLGVRLRELAERETRGIDVVHPAGLGDSKPRRSKRVLVVAAVVTLLAGGLGVRWFVDRDDSAVVEVADAPKGGGSSVSMTLPSVLFEEPTNEADLPDQAIEFFQRVTIPDAEDGDVSLVFAALHRVDGPGDSVVVVGIDSTSRFICQTVQTAAGAGLAGGCVSLASFASRGGMTQIGLGGPDGDISAGLVANEVVEITFDGIAADIVDNVFFSTSPIDATPAGTESITLHYADGTSLQGGNTPPGVAVMGSHNGRPLSEPFAVGCASFDDGFGARLLIIDDGGLFSVTLDQTSIQFSDAVDRIEATLDTASDAATVTSSDTPAGLMIDATWTANDSTGEIHITCGRNHVDARTLPKATAVPDAGSEQDPTGAAGADPFDISLDALVSRSDGARIAAVGDVLTLDFGALPDGWEFDQVVAGTIDGPFGAIYRQQVEVIAPEGIHLVVNVEGRLDGSPINFDRLDYAERTKVRGQPAQTTASMIEWVEQGVARIAILGNATRSIDEELVLLADVLTPVTRSVAWDQTLEPGLVADPADPILAGQLGALEWEIVPTSSGLDLLALVIDGREFGRTPYSTLPDPAEVQISINGLPGGFIIFGHAPPEANQILLHSQSGTESLPIVTHPSGRNAFAAPIPDKLDPLRLEFVDSDNQTLGTFPLDGYPAYLIGGYGTGTTLTID